MWVDSYGTFIKELQPEPSGMQPIHNTKNQIVYTSTDTCQLKTLAI